MEPPLAAASEKSVPWPVSVIERGLPAALSVTTMVAVRFPADAGLNVTLIVQFAPVSTEVPQVFVCEKSSALVPEIVMFVMSSGALPVLVSLTVCAALTVVMS